MSSLIQEIHNASKSNTQVINEMKGCENEEQKVKPKTPRIFSIIKDKFKNVDKSLITLVKVKNAIKSEFKKEAFSVEKEEWEKMSKIEQNQVANTILNKLQK